MDRIADILNKPKGRRVLVVGLALSGVSAARVLVRLGARVFGTDRKATFQSQDVVESLGIPLALECDATEWVRNTDLVVLSPGVPLSSSVPVEAINRGIPVIGELELALRIRPVPLVAVTGTNGKSTTTALCAHLLQAAGDRVFLGGNIGRPLTEWCMYSEEVDWAVIEVSSFQLEHLSSSAQLVPRVGLWLNLTPDHLDRHGNMESYGQLKRRLFEGQSSRETGVFFWDDPLVKKWATGLSGRCVGFSRELSNLGSGGIWIRGRELVPQGLESVKTVLRVTSKQLGGEHNKENAAAAVLAALVLKKNQECIQAGLNSFVGLPHRSVLIRIVDGVQYVDDSKGTNAEATAKTLTAFEQPVILIAGGRGKGTGYSRLRAEVSNRVKHLLLIGEEADNLAKELEGCAEIHHVSGMKEAVLLSKELAQENDVVLLSPACSSFDMFRDYRHRGEVFAECVRKL